MASLLPQLGADGNLKPSPVPYATTLQDIEQDFVANAPYSVERQEIFEFLTLYCKLVWRNWPDAILWINGGFATHKSWAAPSDVDIVVLLPDSTFSTLTVEQVAPFVTLQGVTSQMPDFSLDRLQPFGGFVDSFFVPDALPHRFVWSDTWSKVKRPDGTLDPTARKGFLEVRKP